MPPMFRIPHAVAGLFLLPFLASSPAHAQRSPVDEAWTRYREAEFDAALRTLDEAEENGTIAPADYPRALEIRALSAHALGDPALTESSLRYLAAVDPEYGLGPEAVPALREQLDTFRRAGERAELSVEAREEDGQVRLRAELTRDPLDLVKQLVVFGRVAGEVAWRDGSGELVVPASGASAVEYWAEALGPAGVRLAARGSSDSPLRLPLAASEGGGEGGGLGVGGWLLIGGGVALAVGIVAAVWLAGQGSEDVPVTTVLPWD